MRVSKLVAMSALVAGIATVQNGPIAAAPLAPAIGATALISQVKEISPLVEVRSRRGGAVAAGIAGAIIGGIIASQVYRNDPPYYYGYPYPPYAPYPYAGPGYDGAVAYCLSRFRSYDPYSMSYLGYDGLRHSCP